VVSDSNFGNIEVQLDVSEPTAITLQSVSASSGGNSGMGFVIAGLGLLSLATGMFLILRKHLPIEIGK
jgi:hypothetical protein